MSIMTRKYGLLGQEIYKQMSSKGWKQIDLAREAQIGQSTISKLMREESKATPETLNAIGKALGLSPLYLMRLAGIPLPKERSKRKPAIEHIAQRLDSLPPQVQEEAIASLGAQIDALENAVERMQAKERPTPHDTSLNGTDPGVEELEGLESRKPGDPVDVRARKFTKIVREFQFLFPDEYERIRHALGDRPVVTLV